MGNVAPGAGNPAAFGLNSSVSPFTVTFTGNTTTAGLTVSNMRPTFNLGGFTYNVTGDTLIGGTNGPLLTLTNGTLNTRAGGGRLYVGNNAGQTGTLIVDGGVLNGLCDIGFSGTGTVTVQGGGDVSVSTDWSPTLGNNVGSVGTLTITGVGSSLTQVQNETWVGRAGTGILRLLDGATMTTPTLRAALAGGTADVRVEGGATATVTGQLSVPGGDNAANVASLTVSGLGTTLSAGSLQSYGGGQGTISIAGGGRVNVSGDMSSWVSGTVRTIVVTGEGSQLNFATGGGGRFACTEGSTSVRVEAGAHFGGTWFLMSETELSSTALTVSGSGSSVLLNDFESARGSSELQVLNGANMTVLSQFLMGCCTTPTPKSVLVRGTDSELVCGDYPNTGGATYFRSGSTGLVDQGGKFTVRNNAFVGDQGTGSLTVSGTDSAFVSPYRLHIGGNGNTTGTFNLTNGATATLGSLWMNAGNGSTAAATVTGDSMVFTTDWVEVYEGSTLTVNSGGFVEAGGGIAIRGTQSKPAEIVVGDGSYIFATGRIDLGGNQPVPDLGILTLNGGTAFCLDYMPVNNNGVLRGSGTVDGFVSVSGTIQPGLPIGTLGLTGISTGGRLEIQIGGTAAGTQHDRLTVANGASLNGTLALSLVNGFAPTIGQTFDVLTAGSVSGQFASITGTDLGGGKAFVARYLSNAVQLVVDGVTGVDIAQTNVAVAEGFNSAPLNAVASYVISPSQQVTSSVTWTSDNPSIATVNAEGVVTATGPGNTTIRANYAGFSDSVGVTVRPLPGTPAPLPGIAVNRYGRGVPELDLLTPFLSAQRTTLQMFGNQDISVLTGRTDNVAAKSVGQITIPTTGVYRFWFNPADTWGSLWIDGDPVSRFQRYAYSIAEPVQLSAGVHDVRLDYGLQDAGGPRVMRLDWQGPGIPFQIMPDSALAGPVDVDYYDTTPYVYTNEAVDLSTFHVMDRFQLPNIDIPLAGDPGQLRFEGTVALPDEATYTFTLLVDDGAIVRFNGEEVINVWSNFGQSHTFSRTLSPGIYPIRVDYTDHGGYGGGIQLRVSSSGIVDQVVPQASFSRIAAPTCPADFNGDQFLDFFDYDEYVACFETGICPPGKTADFNGDEFTDFFDYDEYVLAFETGC
ncbi:MAG: hypothetical protein HEQ23_06060 [Tepidisphaera sp.]